MLLPNRDRRWSQASLLALARGYQAPCALAAAADLGLFDAISEGKDTPSKLARVLKCDARGLEMLLNAIVALNILRKDRDRFSISLEVAKFLREDSSRSVQAMIRHQANCLRNWAELANVIKTGRPAQRRSSIRGKMADQEAYIEAMDCTYAPIADRLVRSVRSLRMVSQILDVGGGSGTWIMALLRACPAAGATLVDLPKVISLARRRLVSEGFSNRVKLTGLDFTKNELPRGADLVWLSAIIHQNSRKQNRALFQKIFRAMAPGGRLIVRDIIMEPRRTSPLFGALFALNMLVETEGGGTFTFEELHEDLLSCGFKRVSLIKRDKGMNALVLATKPKSRLR